MSEPIIIAIITIFPSIFTATLLHLREKKKTSTEITGLTDNDQKIIKQALQEQALVLTAEITQLRGEVEELRRNGERLKNFFQSAIDLFRELLSKEKLSPTAYNRIRSLLEEHQHSIGGGNVQH